MNVTAAEKIIITFFDVPSQRVNYIEYVTNIDGKTPIINFDDLEKIPVATNEKLGFVMAGENIDINNEGKISLPERFRVQQISEIQGGILKTLFENWRGKNET